MRPGDYGRKDQILQPTRIAAQGKALNPDISRVELAAAARRRAMTPYYEYCEWPATQRMRSARLARRVGIFQHHRLRKAPSLTGTNRTPRRRPPAGSRYL